MTVTLSGHEGGIRLSVADDGGGFDLDGVSHSRKGIGLASMQERVRLLAGTISIVSKPRQGTTVTVSIPFSPPA